jgi:dipeptidyl aminopeptidase/acylaminoacyl peptidase
MKGEMPTGSVAGAVGGRYRRLWIPDIETGFAMKIIPAFLRLLPLLLIAAPLAAQEPRVLEHTDYDLWNRIQNDLMSADGSWLAYRLVPGGGDASLVIQSLAGDRSVTVERGASPRFTSDSRYLVSLVAPMEGAVDAAREDGQSGDDLPGDSLAIVDLSNFSVTRVADVQSFRMPEEDADWFAYLLKSAGDDVSDAAADSDDEAAEDDDEESAPRLDDGATLVARMFESGSERRFDHVVDYQFASGGSTMFYTASGLDGSADGVFRVGTTESADAVTSGEGRYVQLAVSDEGEAAFLTDRDDRTNEAPAFALYVTENGAATARVALSGSGLTSGWAPSENGDISFSDSGNRVFFGTAIAPRPDAENETPEGDRVEVDIWNWKDPLLQPMQLVQADRERERTYQAMLDLGSGRTLQLATPDMPDVEVGSGGDGDVALGSSDLPYRQLISWDGFYSDLYLVDVTDSSRRLAAEMVRGDGTLSPSERYVTRWDGFEKAWFAVDVETGETINLTGDMAVPFHDLLDDHPDALRSYGSAGWTADDEAFVVYDQFDIWAIDPTGGDAPRNLTEGVGRATDTRFRHLDLDRDDPVVPVDDDVMLSSFHLYTKDAGIYTDRFEGSDAPEGMIEAGARFAGVRRAEDADVVTFTRSTFEEFPDIWVTDSALDDPRKVTDANPQQSEYRWGSAEIVEWTSSDGAPLQGILYKPDGFDPTEKYPMMVYFYERSSDGLHQYFVPAAGSSSINRSFYVSRGYLVFVPDIPYKIGYPGESSVDAVVPGVLGLVDRGFVNRDKIGVQGHSWGGYQISYMVTRTDLFAAAEAGAPVVNMVSAYGGIRWQTGMSRAFQYERTQTRIGGSLWDTPLRYIENSPIFTADKISTPLLMMHNDADGAVPWYQGIEFFVALRRLGQPAWMLNYNGEAHGLRQEHNQRDWAARMQQFFDHYLMDAPVPVWMDEGVPAILKGETLGLKLTNKKVISEQG